MAEAKQHRLTRKDLRAPDEFQTTAGEAVAWLHRNQSAVIGVASAVVAIAAVVLGLGWNAQRQATAASSGLQAAQALFEAGSHAAAAAEYGTIAETYPRTAAGKLALLHRAHALMHQPDYPGAAIAYGEYLATSPATDYLRQEALLGLGRANAAAGNASAASDAYRQAIEVPGPFRTRAQLALARLEDAAGNTESARALYGELLKASDLDAESRRVIESRLPPGTGESASPLAEAQP